jgi:hypothetical protein
VKPGDLVTSTDVLGLALTEKVSDIYRDNYTEVPPGSVGIVLSKPAGMWIRWFVNGHAGWSLVEYLEVLK